MEIEIEDTAMLMAMNMDISTNIDRWTGASRYTKQR